MKCYQLCPFGIRNIIRNVRRHTGEGFCDDLHAFTGAFCLIEWQFGDDYVGTFSAQQNLPQNKTVLEYGRVEVLKTPTYLSKVIK